MRRTQLPFGASQRLTRFGRCSAETRQQASWMAGRSSSLYRQPGLTSCAATYSGRWRNVPLLPP